MQNVGPIYKTKNVYYLKLMLVIIHRAYVLKLFLGILHLDKNHGFLQDQSRGGSRGAPRRAPPPPLKLEKI